jgi:hypothetical protein
VTIDKSQWLLNVKDLALVDEASYTRITEPDTYVLKWKDIVQQDGGAIIDELWRLVFQCIYEANNK